MAELSNAVTVLIARMESHPEDFELYSGGKYPKFGGTADALYGLAGLDAEKAGALWFLPDADKEALIAAWKKYHLAKFEKDVMEKIFDDGEAEREAEELKRRIHYQQMQQRMQMQNAMMNSHQMPQPVTGLNAAQNSTGNTGLFGSAANALTGIFK
jgi:hypothetical protein